MNPLNQGFPPAAIVLPLLQKAGIQLDNLKISPLQGGNNRVFLLANEKQKYVLKHYFASQNETRTRLNAEFSFIAFAWSNGIRVVPEPYACDTENLLGLYQFIEGGKLDREALTGRHISAAMEFISSINSASIRFSEQALRLPFAAESCLNLEQHLASVEHRIKKLSCMAIEDEVSAKAGSFFSSILLPEWNRIKEALSGEQKKNRNIDRGSRIISPSDFGFHNAIIAPDGKVFFIDFEYAGWDGPVKMVCDFFCQPEIPVPINYMEIFADKITGFIEPEYDMKQEIEKLMPLYRLKWCCIMLNPFIQASVKRKAFAFYETDRRELQLEKTVKYAEEHF
ncbi:MAG: aminoglycoside phosphotransferase family protein [Desulfobacula sp.]|jgi:hypothetical protein